MGEDNKCEGCGRCCMVFAWQIHATVKDVKRWLIDSRFDILEKFEGRVVDIKRINCSTLKKGDTITGGADLINPETREPYTKKCPFLNKDEKNRYFCFIHDTKPEMCVFAKPWEYEREKLETTCACPVGLRLHVKSDT